MSVLGSRPSPLPASRPVRDRVGPLTAAALATSALLAGVPSVLDAQFVAVQPTAAVSAGTDADAAGGEPGKPQRGFSFRKEDVKVLDKLSDFRRHVAKKAWEPAFRTIGELADMDLKALVPVGNGLALPSRQQVWRALAELPPDGRDAYRLFNDAKAKQLFERATAPGAADELATLKTIFDRYFITSVGDRAADRLGDAYFEAGEFAAADAAWKAVLAYHPDPATPKPRLRAKRCAALARAGRWAEFEALAADLAGENLVVAGRSVPAAEYVKSLRAAAATPATGPADDRPTTSPATRAADLVVALDDQAAGRMTLPTSNVPAWQSRFGDGGLIEKLTQMQAQGWGVQTDQFAAFVPPSATDGRRVYVNWFGVTFAVDGRTGKMLWRSRKFGDVAEFTQQFVYAGLNPTRYQLTLAGDRVLITGVPFGDLNNHDGRGLRCKLVCHNAETGAVAWATLSGPASGYGVVGPPLVAGRTVYVVGQNAGGQEMHLLALELATGKLLWTIPLGTAQAGVDYRGNSDSPPPTLAEHVGTVYVVTNNGAVLAVDAAARRVAWALAYEPPPIASGERIFFSNDTYAPPRPAPGAAVVRGSTLYVKETAGPALHAIDLGGPTVAWSRPIDADATIVGLDDRSVYVLGRELAAIDLATRAMRWGTKIPSGADPARAIRGGDAVYAYASRGVYEVDAATGDPSPAIFRPADAEAVGGRMYRLADRLITVSNVAVTAYPLVPAAASEAGKPAGGGRGNGTGGARAD